MNDNLKTEDRKQLHTYIHPTAHKNIHDWCQSNSVTLSGLLEVLGLQLPRNNELDRELQELVFAARLVDKNRRSRMNRGRAFRK